MSSSRYSTRRFTRWSVVFMLVLLPAALFACGSPTDPDPDPDPDPGPAPVASVAVTPASASIEVGATQAFSASTLAAGGAVLTGRTVTWSVANTGVATVDASGTVTGVAEGSTTVSATSEGVVGTATVDVIPVPVVAVVVTPDSVTLAVGEGTTLAAETRDASGGVLTGREVRWLSSDPAIATVDSITGAVSAVGVGTTSIVATSEAVSDTVTVVVTDVPLPAGFNKVWRSDAPDTVWSNAANWTPAGAPSAADTVLIQAGPNQPTMDEDGEAASITIADSARLSLGGFLLEVSGDVVAGGLGIVGSGILEITGPGSVEGAVPALDVSGSASLAGATIATGEVRVVQSGSLSIGAHTLTVGGRFRTANSAVLVMQDAAGVLDVEGETRFSGGIQSTLLTAGTIRSAGDFNQFASGTSASFEATDDHLVVLDGTGPQTLTMASAGTSASQSHFAHLEIAGTAVTVASVSHAEGDVSVTSAATVDGPGEIETLGGVTTIAGSSLTLGRVGLAGALSAAGTFSPGTTDFMGSGQMIQPGLAYQTIEVGGTASLTGTTAASGEVRVVEMGRLTIGAETLTVGGRFRTVNSGVLVMQDAAGVLDIEGETLFQGGIEDGLLTAGTIRSAGDFNQFTGGTSRSFTATDDHLVVFDGESAQTLTMSTSGTTPGASHFANIEIAGTAVTIAAVSHAEGDVSVTTAATVDGAGELEAMGDLTTVAGSSVTLSRMAFGGAMSVAGTFSPGTTDFMGSGQMIQAGLAYQTIEVGGSASLTGTTAATGEVRVVDTGSLSIGAETLTVGGRFRTVNSGVLVMQDAAGVLDIEGETRFQGGIEHGLLTAGTIRSAGDFNQFTGGTSTSFAATDDHLVVLDGTTAQTVTMSSSGTAPSSSHFANIEIAGTAVTIAAVSHAEGDVSVTTAATVDGAGELEAMGDLTTVAGSAVTLGRMAFGGAMSVAGTFSPGTTDFMGAGQMIQAGLAYQTIEVGGSASLTGTTAATGEVRVVDTGSLTIGAETLTVGGRFRTVNSGVLVMQDAAGVLDIEGETRFQGGIENGLLTAGTIRAAGDFNQFTGGTSTSFAATDDHLVVFDGTSAQTVTMVTGGTGPSSSHFAHIEIAGVDVTLSPLGSLFVIEGDMTLSGAATVGSGDVVEILGDAILESASSLVNDGTVNVTGTCTDNGATVTGTGTGNAACVIP